MTRDEHIKHHQKLHRGLDRLVADFAKHTGESLEEATVMDLLEWSHEQTTNPMWGEHKKEGGR